MAEQKSRLVLEIDSRDAEQKAEDVRKALGALEDAGIRVKPAMDKAGAGLDGVGKSATKASQNLGQLDKSSDGAGKATVSSSEKYAEASARLLAMATSSLQASDYVKSLTASTSAASVSFDAASDKIRSITSLSARLRAESDALAGSTDKASVSTRNASVATDLQVKELAELLGKINPAVAALGRLDDMQSKLGQFHKAGLLDTETFKDYSTRLDSTRQGLSAFDEGLSKTGISARQTETALRQLPSQFTDIFTSLAAGQNPLLVLLQQGGQIKDSFGGIGNTVDVLGGKVKGFFSSIAGSSAGIAGAGAALGDLVSHQNAVAEGSEAAADGLGGMAEGANTAADASKNAKEAIAALGAGAGGAGISMLAMVGAATAAAAAIGLLIYAYNKGSKEADAYNNALILTGNYAGTTAADLGDMAKRVGSSTTTVADAATALAMLAESAKIPVAQFEMISTTALQMEDATGKAIRETIAEFEKIADSPTKAIAALNEKYGFLTASVYEQVRALEHHGDRQAAAVIAENAYATAMDARSEQIKKNLGAIERAWDDVTSAAKSGWDAIFDIGRKDTSGPDVTKIQQKINYLKSTLGSGYEDADTQAQIKALQAQVDAVNKINGAARKRAAAEGEATRIQREGQAGYEKFQQGLESNFSKRQKMDRALKDGQEEINKARLAGYKITTEQEAAALKAIRDNPIYKEPKTPKGKPYTEDSGQKMLDEARQRFAVLQQQGQAITDQANGTATLGTEAKKLIELETMLADLKTKDTLTASQKQLLAMGELNVAQQRLNAGLEEQNKLASVQVQNAAKLKAYQDNLTSRLDSSQEELNSRLAGAGLGGEAKSRLQEDLKIQQDYQKRLNKLTNDYTNSTDKSLGRTKLYDDEVALEKAALDKRVEQQKGYYASLDELRGNWLAGASTAWQSYLEIATNYNQQTQEATAQLLGDTTSSISDQIQGLVKGTTSLGDAFGNLAGTMSGSVLQALSDIAAKWVVVHALKMAGITAETGAVVTSEGIKTTAKLTTDAVSTSSTLAAIATTLAANVSAAATTIASWLPAALVASIGSFGAAAVVGGTALIAAYALIKGFSSGGYTGAGGVNEPAGMVHKGEVVWSQADISRFGGVAAVESLRKGNVSPIGVARSGSAGSSAGKSSGTSTPTPLTVNLIENPSKAGQVERGRNSDGSESLTLFAAQIRAGGNEASDTFESVYGLKRSPG